MQKLLNPQIWKVTIQFLKITCIIFRRKIGIEINCYASRNCCCYGTGCRSCWRSRICTRTGYNCSSISYSIDYCWDKRGTSSPFRRGVDRSRNIGRSSIITVIRVWSGSGPLWTCLCTAATLAIGFIMKDYVLKKKKIH